MTIFKKLPDDILNYLNDFIDIKSKIILFYSKTNNQELIKVCYIKRITKNYKYLTDKILQQNIFDQLVEINADYNYQINNLNRFSQTLKIVSISDICGVNDNGIKDCLKLTNIYASNNRKIKDLNKFYQTLKIIDISMNCGVDDNGIRFSQTLLIIYISGDCGVDDNGIKDCFKLIEINAYNF